MDGCGWWIAAIELWRPSGADAPKAVSELGDDQASVMVRSDFGYRSYERCDGGCASDKPDWTNGGVPV